MQGIDLDTLGVGQIKGEQCRPEQQHADSADRDICVAVGVILVDELARLRFVVLDLCLDLFTGQIPVIGTHYGNGLRVSACACCEQHQAEQYGWALHGPLPKTALFVPEQCDVRAAVAPGQVQTYPLRRSKSEATAAQIRSA
jgi:hypothetical protein